MELLSTLFSKAKDRNSVAQKSEKGGIKTLWVTYSWDDNLSGDVEFIAQELINAGIRVKLDRWDIRAGERLWSQIENFITNPNESDGWAIYATHNSLSSQPCQEELAYALDRALRTRSGTFPLIGIFNGTVEGDLIPKAISTRLYVNTGDRDWKTRVVSAVNGGELNIARESLEPFAVTVHKSQNSYIIEVRPRVEAWHTFFFGIPASMREGESLYMIPAQSGGLLSRSYGFMGSVDEPALSVDKNYWCRVIETNFAGGWSYYCGVNKLPEIIVFGVPNTAGKQWHYNLKEHVAKHGVKIK